MFIIHPLPAGAVDTDAPVTVQKIAEQVQRRVLSVRAYDDDAMMTTATVLEGERFEERATELLDDPGVAFLHVHFAGPGCFAFRVDRA
jgi:Protein of unknown function (DUF1203)